MKDIKNDRTIAMNTPRNTLTPNDIDDKIETLRARLNSAISASKVPIAQNPKVLTLSHTFDTLINQLQMGKKK